MQEEEAGAEVQEEQRAFTKVLLRMEETFRQMQARLDALAARVEDVYMEVTLKRRERAICF
jgi:tetrahydromethanopterin S-methyltransferase subunit G